VVPAPPDLGLELISVPKDSDLELDLSLTSVSEGVYVSGTVLESEPPRRLRLTFGDPGMTDPTIVTFDIEPFHDIVRLTVTHENLPDEEALRAISHGWPAVCANLKSLLETGHVLPQPPWEMHAELRVPD